MILYSYRKDKHGEMLVYRKGRTAGSMDRIESSFEEFDLSCDFPARESFREALLERLLALNEQQASPQAGAARIVMLSDSELEMLAAAQGDDAVPAEISLDDLPPVDGQ